MEGHEMTYLIVRHKGNRYSVFCPETYGMGTWGMGSQDSIIKKRKHWYIRYWKGGNYDLDIPDYEEDIRLNVVFTSKRRNAVSAYLMRSKACAADFMRIQADIDEAHKDLIAFNRWCRK